MTCYVCFFCCHHCHQEALYAAALALGGTGSWVCRMTTVTFAVAVEPHMHCNACCGSVGHKWALVISSVVLRAARACLLHGYGCERRGHGGTLMVLQRDYTSSPLCPCTCGSPIDSMQVRSQRRPTGRCSCAMVFWRRPSKTLNMFRHS